MVDTIFTFAGSNGDIISGFGQKETEGYDVVADLWTSKADVPTKRYGCYAAMVGDVAYVIGGEDWMFFIPITYDVNEAYNTQTNSWSTRAPRPRVGLDMGVVSDGSLIYAMGGVPWTDANDIYDPVANSWSSGAVLPTTMAEFGVAYLAGKIYVICGRNPVHLHGTSTCYVYDIAGDSWSPIASTPETRYYIQAVEIGGKIYAVGGADFADDTQANCWEYDPVGDSWAVKTPMVVPRDSFPAVGYNGKLYVIGGNTTIGHTDTVEVYDPVSNTWSFATPHPRGVTEYYFAGVAIVAAPPPPPSVVRYLSLGKTQKGFHKEPITHLHLGK